MIVSEEPQDLYSTEKPAELYDIIERFCLGRRRIELFGLQRNVRDGWLNIGSAIRETNFSPELYPTPYIHYFMLTVSLPLSSSLLVYVCYILIERRKGMFISLAWICVH